MKNLISHLFTALTQYQKSKFEFRKDYLILQHQIEIEKIEFSKEPTYHVTEKIFADILNKCGGSLTHKFTGEISQYGFPFKNHEENLTKGCCFNRHIFSESDFDAMLELLLTQGISLIKKENIKSN